MLFEPAGHPDSVWMISPPSFLASTLSSAAAASAQLFTSTPFSEYTLRPPARSFSLDSKLVILKSSELHAATASPIPWMKLVAMATVNTIILLFMLGDRKGVV